MQRVAVGQRRAAARPVVARLRLGLGLALGLGLGLGLGSEPDARLRHGAGRSQCGGPCDLPQSHTLHSRPDMPLLRAAMRPVDEAAARLAGRPG